jgi:hypothetical protein
LKARNRNLVVIGLLALGAASGFLFIRNLVDFPVYYSAGRALIAGRTDLYAPDFALGPVMDYRYPPLFLVSLIPLWHMPYEVAAFIWHLVSIIAIGLMLAAILSIAATPRVSNPGDSAVGWFAVLIPTLIAAQYFVMVLHYGNAHLLVTMLVFASFYLASRGRDVAAGGAMALAIAIKLFPALLLPYFALKRKWSYLSSTAIVCLLLLLAPSVYFGFRQNAALLGEWFDLVVMNQSFHETNGPINLALKGLVIRYCTDVDYSKRIDGDTAYPAVNALSLPASPVSFASTLAGFLIWAIVLAWLWRRSSLKNRRTERAGAPAGSLDPLEFGLVLSATLMAGPLTSKIYFIALLWPALVLTAIRTALEEDSRRVVTRILVAAAVINFVLPLLPGREIQRLLLVIGADFYVNALLAIGLVRALAGQRLPSDASSDRWQTAAR